MKSVITETTLKACWMRMDLSAVHSTQIPRPRVPLQLLFLLIQWTDRCLRYSTSKRLQSVETTQRHTEKTLSKLLNETIKKQAERDIFTLNMMCITVYRIWFNLMQNIHFIMCLHEINSHRRLYWFLISTFLVVIPGKDFKNQDASL